MTGIVSPKLLVDADILIKLAVLDCFTDCIQSVGYSVRECATLNSMRISAGINKPAVRERKAGAGLPAQRLLATLQLIPAVDHLTAAEIQMSSEVTRISQRHGLSVDGGEAVLMSMSIQRGIPYLTTGDKKAIRSLPELARYLPDFQRLKGRLMPLEYLILRLVQAQGLAVVFSRINSGLACDKSLRDIFTAAGQNQRLVEHGLNAKLENLRRDADGYLKS